MDEDLFTLTISKLMDKAKEDGIITDDELEMIKQVEVDADSYNLILQEALDDDIITEDEEQKLEELKSLIMERAETIAGLDGEYSDDENTLLKTLSEILAHHYKTK